MGIEQKLAELKEQLSNMVATLDLLMQHNDAHEKRIECIEAVIGKIPLRENALEVERNNPMGKEIKVDNRSTDQRLMDLEIKMELLQRQVGEYDGAFMRVGQFIETVGKAACDANRIEPEEKK